MTLATLAALFATALMLGGMVFFAAGVAPLVFTRLPPERAGPFIRQVFPVYYIYVLGTAAAASLALLSSRPYDALAMFAIASSAGWTRQYLMPAINIASDAVQAGDLDFKGRFVRRHRLSVTLNFAQMIVGAVVLARFIT